MSLSVVPYALGAAGLLQSADSAGRARRDANRAQGEANNEAARRREIQQRVQSMIDGSAQYAESEGVRRGERVRSRFQKDSAQLQESTAGAFRIAGYKPGDTVTGDAVTRVGREREMRWDELVDTFIQQAKSERMSEAGAMAQSAGITGPNMEYYSNQANQYRQQAANASAGVGGSLQTILGALPKPGVNTPVQPPTQPAGQETLATYDTPQVNPYKGFDSLNVSELFPKRKTGRFDSPLF
jgi:hypothetical protein